MVTLFARMASTSLKHVGLIVNDKHSMRVDVGSWNAMEPIYQCG